MSLHTEVGIKPIGPPPQHETDQLDLTLQYTTSRVTNRITALALLHQEGSPT